MRYTPKILLAALGLVSPVIAFAQDEGDPYEDLGLYSESPDFENEQALAEAAEAEAEAAAIEALQNPTESDFRREYSNFVRLVEEQNFDEADISAKRVIQMAIRLFGPQSLETAKALNNLAIVQNSNQQYDAAIQNFASSIEIIELQEDRLNSALVNPLRGLGSAQLGGGRPDLASKSFTRATHITHVNDGPHNIEQVEILEALAEAFVQLGDIDAARSVLNRIHILNVKHFSGDALGLLPSLMRRATWQHRAGYYNDERATYRSAVRIIEDAAGKNDPLLVDPLIKLGESFYYYEPLPDSSQNGFAVSATGETYLKRANRIARRSEDFPWLELATTRLALADYYIVGQSYSRAKNIYEEVWNSLSSDDERMAMRRELLEQPLPIWVEPLPAHTNAAAGMSSTAPGEIQIGTVTVTYSVTQKGRVRIEETVSEPAEFTDMQRMVEREVKRRIYRPRIVNGVTTGADSQTFRHEFRYRMSELEQMRRENREREEGRS